MNRRPLRPIVNMSPIDTQYFDSFNISLWELTTSDCRFRTFPDAHRMAFAMAFDCSYQTSYTGADDEDIDTGRRTALYIVK